MDVYRLADAASRRAFFYGVASSMSEDEISLFHVYLACRRARCDILGDQRMPTELQLQIADDLDVLDIWNCTKVCRNWRLLLLRNETIACHMLAKWFPSCENSLPMDQKLQLFSQNLRKKYLRATGRFRWR